MKTVNILLYEGVDELDFCGPLETLASCREVVEGKWTDKPVFLVETVGARAGSVKCAHGLTVIPDKQVTQAREADIVIVPGGPGARKPGFPSILLEFLTRTSLTTELIASVSTGAFLVAKTGIADGRRLATHYALAAELARQYPAVQVVQGQRVVTDGKDLISSAGISAGVDLALAVAERYAGRQSSRMTARRLEWPGG